MNKIRCSLLPHDAKLKNFEVFGELQTAFIWNEKTERNDILILEDIRFVLKKYDIEVIVKPGFICDGGSVPRAFWSSVGSPYATRLLLAFILHDALYGAEVFPTHSECDWIFLELMQELGSSWYTRNKVWLAVRAFGGTVWSEHDEDSIATARTFIEKIDIHPKQRKNQK